MKIAIIISPDPAGKNIEENLLQLAPFKNNEYKDITVYHTDKKCIYNENIDIKVKADLFIFATTHRSSANINSLSVHPIGNWNKAEFGGKDKTLCIAPALYLKTAYNYLLKNNNTKEFDIVNEVTHHGPYLKKPVFFIEIGSSEEQWKNKEAGRIIAKTILDTSTNKIKNYKTAIGIGGLHTCPIFNKVIQEKDIAIGHICPKYMLKELTKELILQAIEKTIPRPELVLLDWKGLGQEKTRILSLLQELNIKYIRTDKL